MDPNINISARRQIMWAKMNKEWERMQGSSFRQKAPQAQAFRKDTIDPEEYRRWAQPAALKGHSNDSCLSVCLCVSLYVHVVVVLRLVL